MAEETAVRKALNLVFQYVGSSEDQIRNLQTSEDALILRNGLLVEQLRDAERRAHRAEERERQLTATSKELTRKVDDLTQRVDENENDLLRRLQDAEKRAATYETRNNELAAAAELGSRLQQVAEKLVDALDRLPVRMEDAAMIPGATRPEIPLYGTSDWQNVANAKFGVKQVLKGGDE